MKLIVMNVLSMVTKLFFMEYNINHFSWFAQTL